MSECRESDADDVVLRGLMAAYQDGSLEAFDNLYGMLEGELRRFFGARCRDAVRVDDLLQETFLQVHRSRRAYLRDRPVRPWVYAIAKRVFLMHVRTVHRRETPEATALSSIAEPATAGAERDAVARLALSDALSQIPNAGRRAFLLHHHHGFSFGEVASALGINPGAAKLRSSRAARTLRRLLDGQKGTSDD